VLLCDGRFRNTDNTSDLNKPISNATQTALDLKVNLTSFHRNKDRCNFKAMVGLGNVNNTSDLNKPV
jgi:hypothetical protein